MKKALKTRVLCKAENQYHSISFCIDADGTATVVSSGCGDITAAAKRIAGTCSLGKSIMETSCAGLAALVLHGIPTAFKQPPLGEYIQWGAWKSLYTRFEDNKIVKLTVERERRAMRKRDKERKAAQPPAGA